MPDWPSFKGETPSEDLLLNPLAVDDQLKSDWNALRGVEATHPVDGELPRMTKEMRKEFVLGVINGSIFTSEQIRVHKMGACTSCEDFPTRVFDDQEFRCFRCGGDAANITFQPDIDLGMVFLPLAIGALAGWTQESFKKIGCIYAYLQNALPRGINGYPMFTECKLMHMLDWQIVSKVLSREMQRLRNIEEELGED